MTDKPDPFAALRPQIDWKDMRNSARASRVTSQRRAKDLESPDPAVRLAAMRPIYGTGLTAAQKHADWVRQQKIRGARK